MTDLDFYLTYNVMVKGTLANPDPLKSPMWYQESVLVFNSGRYVGSFEYEVAIAKTEDGYKVTDAVAYCGGGSDHDPFLEEFLNDRCFSVEAFCAGHFDAKRAQALAAAGYGYDADSHYRDVKNAFAFDRVLYGFEDAHFYGRA